MLVFVHSLPVHQPFAIVSAVKSHLVDDTIALIYLSGRRRIYWIETCHFLASCTALLGEDKDWLAQCPDNVT